MEKESKGLQGLILLSIHIYRLIVCNSFRSNLTHNLCHNSEKKQRKVLMQVLPFVIRYQNDD